MEDPSASRVTLQAHANSYYNACDRIYLPITFARFKTIKGSNDVVKGGLEVT